MRFGTLEPKPDFLPPARCCRLQTPAYTHTCCCRPWVVSLSKPANPELRHCNRTKATAKNSIRFSIVICYSAYLPVLASFFCKFSELVAVEFDFKFLIVGQFISHLVYHFLFGNLNGNIGFISTILILIHFSQVLDASLSILSTT